MSNMLESLAQIREINAEFPYTAPIKEWKSRGRKVIGWLCTYTPEEIIHAAGMLPVRITGDVTEHNLDAATAYLHIVSCSAVRSCFQLGLNKRYDFLDGIVAGSSCDSIRRLFQVWSRYIPVPFMYLLIPPGKITEAAHELYRTMVIEFKERLEEFFKVRITAEALLDSVALFNRTRQLLKELDELRKLDTPPITGAETLEVLNASMKMPKEQFNPILETLLQEATSSKRALNQKIRVAICGSMCNSAEFINFIEEQGCIVVADELCTGARYYRDLVETNPSLDPLEAICRRYLSHFPCARMFPSEDRLHQVSGLVSEYRVQGVICQTIRYCVPYAYDQPLLRRTLEDQGIPVLELAIEYGAGKSGQLRTRVQAFLEMLGKE